MADYSFSNIIKQNNEKCIGDLLSCGSLILKSSGNRKAQEESALLLSYLLNREKSDLFLNRNLTVPKKTINKYFQWINKRREGFPLQYITGFQNFMGLEFVLSEGVFIPRPETEILVEKVIQLIELIHRGKQLFLLDLGVGCGVIPVTICYYLQKKKKNINFYAVDLSEKAITLAYKNAQRFNCIDAIQFYCGDLFQPLRKNVLSVNLDGIISNPPYLSQKEWENLPSEIRHFEPKTALLAGERGLDYYEKIIAQSPDFLKPGGFLALEIGHTQKEAICQMIKCNSSYQSKICLFRDYYQNDRVIIAFKK